MTNITPVELRKLAIELGRHYGDGAEALCSRAADEIEESRQEIIRLQTEAEAMDLARSEERTLRQNLIVEVARLREALEWYADDANWETRDNDGKWRNGNACEVRGERARAALALTTEKSK